MPSEADQRRIEEYREEAKATPQIQDRSRGTEILGKAQLHQLRRLEQGRAHALSKFEAVNNRDLNSSAAGFAGADQDRRQQARRPVSIADQDVAGREGGIIASGQSTNPRRRKSERKSSITRTSISRSGLLTNPAESTLR